jgi:hypothetical protein
MLLVSRANDDIVVSEPQNPIATISEYFVSRFHTTERIENRPRIKLPIVLMRSMLMGSVPRISGYSASLYLKNAPAAAPTARNTISIPFIFAHHVFTIGRHY